MPVSSDDVDSDLRALGPSNVWNNGYTYYFSEIEHLGTLSDSATKRKGVVRNHIYNATINKLSGLGTPVFDPEEVIIPTRPTEEDTYMAAQIKVLSWRVVNQNVEFEW